MLKLSDIEAILTCKTKTQILDLLKQDNFYQGLQEKFWKVSTKLQDVYSYAPDKKMIVKQPSFLCSEYSMTIGLKQYNLSMLKINSVALGSKYYIKILNEGLWPELAVFIYNCCVILARSFIWSGKEIRSREATTQGDPTAMAT